MTAYKKKMSDVGEGVELHLTQQEFEELFDIIEMGVSFYSQSFGITEEEESERRRKLFAWRKTTGIYTL